MSILIRPALLAVIFHLYILIQQQIQAMPEACAIPGTRLNMGLWYQIDMKLFTPGYLTWTTKEHYGDGIYWYLHYVFKLSDTTKYKEGGEMYEGTLWEFHPSEQTSDWFKMRNTRFPDSFVTWSTTDFVNAHREKNVSNYVILDKGRNEDDFLLKPILAQTVKGEQGQIHYYQLKFKKYPKGYLTWTHDTKNSHYIQNDLRDNMNPDMKHYDKGYGWFVDTLFRFDEVKESASLEGCSNANENSVGKIECKIVLNVLLSSFAIYFSRIRIYHVHL